jgi:hypothetical protein
MDKRYFIRNDDVGARTPALVRYVETFLRAELPVSYQVIPVKLTAECARWLSDLQSHHPDLIEFGQHGLKHEMIVRGKRVWREFGPERSAAEQLHAIRLGKEMIEDALGPVAVFTPPQHKYDRNTLMAAHAVGHRVLSAASYTHVAYRSAYALGRAAKLSSLRHHGLSRHGRMREDVPLLELSISIAIDNGGTVTTPPEHLSARLVHAAGISRIIGVMTHHEVYAEQPELLSALAKTLVDCVPDQIATLTGIAQQLTTQDSRCIPQGPANTMSWDQIRPIRHRAGTHQPD